MSKQEVLKVVPARYPLRLIGALFSLFILAAIVQSVAGNARWEWGVFAEWFFAPAVLAGLGQTLLLTLLGTLFSILFGTLLALARLSRSYLLASLARGYIWLFRSLPLILVLIILYNFSYLYDAISLGIPFTSVVFASYPTIDILGQFAVAVLGLTLVQSAYTAEIIRGGILGRGLRPARSGGGAGPAGLSPHLPHHSAAGAAIHYSDRIQRDHQSGERHLNRLRAGAAGAVLHHPGGSITAPSR